MQATMHALGFPPLHSRPRTPNNNLPTEALSRTAKHHTSLPAHGFDELNEARRLAAYFLDANHQPLPAKGNFMSTPAPTVPYGGGDTLPATGHPLLSPILFLLTREFF